MKVVKGLSAGIVICMLCACVSIKDDAPGNFSLATVPGKGLGFFSLSSNLTANVLKQNIYLVYRKQGESPDNIIMFWRHGYVQEGNNWRLVVLDLEPGNYELKKILVVNAGDVSETPIHYPFTIEGGAATYFGQVIIMVGSGGLGGMITFGHDDLTGERDIALFKKKYSAVRESQIQRSSFGQR